MPEVVEIGSLADSANIQKPAENGGSLFMTKGGKHVRKK